MRAGFPCLSALGLWLASQPARAADLEVFSANAFSLSGDVRLVAADGERSWLDEGFGKLRGSGTASGNLRVKPELGLVDLVWQPRLGFAWSATVVGTLQGGEKTRAGLSEAFISYKPMRREKLRLSVRAGLMWVPLSLEHGGADWHVIDTVTPSAINSWVGEEVRPLAAEATLSTKIGAQQLSGTIAVIAVNDTAGALLTLRGWGLHDRKTLAFQRQSLPPLPPLLLGSQPQFTTPLLDVKEGFAKRPGFYAKLAWTPQAPIRVELFHYDNRADPEAVNEHLEWGWRTRFDNVGLVGKLGPSTTLKAQAMRGTTRMGFGGQRRWIDAQFRSAFLLATHEFGKMRVAGRIEGFDVRNKGSRVTPQDDDRGWATTFAVTRELSGHFSLAGEFVHVSSNRQQRASAGLAERQPQSQLQILLKARW